MHAVRNAFALAIARDELALFYQPKINLRNNRIEGVEALVRWRRNGRLEMPGAFFPAIENTDLMRELDWWVLREACASPANGWRKAAISRSASICPPSR